MIFSKRVGEELLFFNNMIKILKITLKLTSYIKNKSLEYTTIQGF